MEHEFVKLHIPGDDASSTSKISAQTPAQII